jgi:hypothetical protein
LRLIVSLERRVYSELIKQSHQDYACPFEGTLLLTVSNKPLSCQL